MDTTCAGVPASDDHDELASTVVDAQAISAPAADEQGQDKTGQACPSLYRPCLPASPYAPISSPNSSRERLTRSFPPLGLYSSCKEDSGRHLFRPTAAPKSTCISNRVSRNTAGQTVDLPLLPLSVNRHGAGTPQGGEAGGGSDRAKGSRRSSPAPPLLSSSSQLAPLSSRSPIPPRQLAPPLPPLYSSGPPRSHHHLVPLPTTLDRLPPIVHQSCAAPLSRESRSTKLFADRLAHPLQGGPLLSIHCTSSTSTEGIIGSKRRRDEDDDNSSGRKQTTHAISAQRPLPLNALGRHDRSSSSYRHHTHPDSLSLIESCKHLSDQSSRHITTKSSRQSHRHDANETPGQSRLDFHPLWSDEVMSPTVFHTRKKHRAHASASIYAPRKRRSGRVRGEQGRQRKHQEDELSDDNDAEQEDDGSGDEENDSDYEQSKQILLRERPSTRTLKRLSEKAGTATASHTPMPPPASNRRNNAKARATRVRIPIACDPCRAFKRKCSGHLPCELCARRGRGEDCKYDPGPASTLLAQQAIARGLALPDTTIVREEKGENDPNCKNTLPFYPMKMSPVSKGEVIKEPEAVERESTSPSRSSTSAKKNEQTAGDVSSDSDCSGFEFEDDSTMQRNDKAAIRNPSARFTLSETYYQPLEPLVFQRARGLAGPVPQLPPTRSLPHPHHQTHLASYNANGHYYKDPHQAGQGIIYEPALSTAGCTTIKQAGEPVEEQTPLRVRSHSVSILQSHHADKGLPPHGPKSYSSTSFYPALSCSYTNAPFYEGHQKQSAWVQRTEKGGSTLGPSPQVFQMSHAMERSPRQAYYYPAATSRVDARAPIVPSQMPTVPRMTVNTSGSWQVQHGKGLEIGEVDTGGQWALPGATRGGEQYNIVGHRQPHVSQSHCYQGDELPCRYSDSVPTLSRMILSRAEPCREKQNVDAATSGAKWGDENQESKVMPRDQCTDLDKLAEAVDKIKGEPHHAMATRGKKARSRRQSMVVGET